MAILAKGDRRTLVGAVPLAAVGLLCMLSFFAYLPQAPLRSPFPEDVLADFTKVFPQGWGFFTKSQDIPLYTPYFREGDSFIAALPGSSGGPQFAFGLNRHGRNILIEAEVLERLLQERDLADCPTGTMADCFRGLDDSDAIKMANPMKEPLMCGPVFVAQQEIVPWQWRDLTDQPTRTTAVGVVDLAC